MGEFYRETLREGKNLNIAPLLQEAGKEGRETSKSSNVAFSRSGRFLDKVKVPMPEHGTGHVHLTLGILVISGL